MALLLVGAAAHVMYTTRYPRCCLLGSHFYVVVPGIICSFKKPKLFKNDCHSNWHPALPLRAALTRSLLRLLLSRTTTSKQVMRVRLNRGLRVVPAASGCLFLATLQKSAHAVIVRIRSARCTPCTSSSGGEIGIIIHISYHTIRTNITFGEVYTSCSVYEELRLCLLPCLSVRVGAPVYEYVPVRTAG